MRAVRHLLWVDCAAAATAGALVLLLGPWLIEVYRLPRGLLLFIGVKLILHALHVNEVPFINGGEPVTWVPEIPIWLSLLVIVATLTLTALASLWKVRVESRRS